MSATTMTMDHENRGGFFGRSFVRLTIAALMAVMVLGAISNAASARTTTTTMGQNDFTSQCRGGGGTPERVGTHVVKCTKKNGTVVTCDFNSSPATCIIATPRWSSGHLGTVLTGGVLEAEPASGGPRVLPGRVPVTDAVLVEAEPASAVPDTTVSASEIQVIEPIPADDPAAPSAPAGEAAPATEQVLVAEPAVIEVVEDEESSSQQ
jgi:hypothetical protein